MQQWETPRGILKKYIGSKHSKPPTLTYWLDLNTPKTIPAFVCLQRCAGQQEAWSTRDSIHHLAFSGLDVFRLQWIARHPRVVEYHRSVWCKDVKLEGWIHLNCCVKDVFLSIHSSLRFLATQNPLPKSTGCKLAKITGNTPPNLNKSFDLESFCLQTTIFGVVSGEVVIVCTCLHGFSRCSFDVFLPSLDFTRKSTIVRGFNPKKQILSLTQFFTIKKLQQIPLSTIFHRKKKAKEKAQIFDFRNHPHHF